MSGAREGGREIRHEPAPCSSRGCAGGMRDRGRAAAGAVRRRPGRACDAPHRPGKLGVVVKHSPDDDCWFDWADDNEAAVKLKLWAPTAQSVSLQLFDHENDAAPETTVAMHEHNGVWVARGTTDWKGKYYLYSVNVYVPVDKTVDTNVTSDPYSIDIALNGAKSRITDLNSESTKPAGWDYSFSPPLNSLNDISIYELHIRDFSVGDSTVPSVHRGMYDALADQNTVQVLFRAQRNW